MIVQYVSSDEEMLREIEGAQYRPQQGDTVELATHSGGGARALVTHVHAVVMDSQFSTVVTATLRKPRSEFPDEIAQ